MRPQAWKEHLIPGANTPVNSLARENEYRRIVNIPTRIGYLEEKLPRYLEVPTCM